MSESRESTGGGPRVLYCRCAYAQVVPQETKDRVLEKLAASGRSFDTVSDLCQMSARRDPALERIAEDGNVRIAACYPRAVKGLFQAAGHPLPGKGAEVLNMRTQEADGLVETLLSEEPPEGNLPAGGGNGDNVGEDGQAGDDGKENRV